MHILGGNSTGAAGAVGHGNALSELSFSNRSQETGRHIGAAAGTPSDNAFNGARWEGARRRAAAHN